MTQTALPFAAKSDRSRALVAPMLGYLAGRGWVKSRELEQRFGVSDRVVRAVAAMSDGQIISGQKGYALLSDATVREANHAADWLLHQAKEMTERAYRIRRAIHRRTA